MNRTSFVRAELSPAAELDATLVRLQESGATIYNIYPYYGNVSGGTTDVGLGKSELGMKMTPSFVVTYRGAITTVPFGNEAGAPTGASL